jgi:hypothetical protein
MQVDHDGGGVSEPLAGALTRLLASAPTWNRMPAARLG